MVSKKEYNLEYQRECLQLILNASGQAEEGFIAADGNGIVVKLFEFMRSGDVSNSILAAKV
jgi:hypothetical protein